MHRAPIGGDIAIDEGIADPPRFDEGAAQLRGGLRDDFDAAAPTPDPQRKVVADAFDHHFAQADILRGQVGFDADIFERLELIVNLDDVGFVKAVAPALVVAQRAGEDGIGIAEKRLAIGGEDLEKFQRGAVGGEVELDVARRDHAPQIDFNPPILDAGVWIGSPIGRPVAVDEMAGVAGVGTHFADAAAGKVRGVGDGVDVAADKGGFERTARDVDGVAGQLPLAPVVGGGDAKLVASEGRGEQQGTYKDGVAHGMYPVEPSQ